MRPLVLLALANGFLSFGFVDTSWSFQRNLSSSATVPILMSHMVALIAVACSLAHSLFLVSRSHAQLVLGNPGSTSSSAHEGSVVATRSGVEPSQVRPVVTLFRAASICSSKVRVVSVNMFVVRLCFQETFVSVNLDKVFHVDGSDNVVVVLCASIEDLGHRLELETHRVQLSTGPGASLHP